MEVKNQSILRLVFLLCAGLSLLFFADAGASQFVEGVEGSFVANFIWGAVFGLLAFRAARQLSKNRKEALEVQKDLEIDDNKVEQRQRSFRLYKPTTRHYLIEVLGSLVFMIISGFLCLLAMRGGDFVLMFVSLPFLIVSTLNFFFSLLGMGLGSLRKN